MSNYNTSSSGYSSVSSITAPNSYDALNAEQKKILNAMRTMYYRGVSEKFSPENISVISFDPK